MGLIVDVGKGRINSGRFVVCDIGSSCLATASFVCGWLKRRQC